MFNKIYSRGRSRRRRDAGFRTRGNSLAWVWLLVGMMLGLLGAMLFYSQVLTAPKNVKTSKLHNRAKVVTAQDANKQYEFYSILPEMEVELIPDNASNTSPIIVTEKPTTPMLSSNDNPPGIMNTTPLPKKTPPSNQKSKGETQTQLNPKVYPQSKPKVETQSNFKVENNSKPKVDTKSKPKMHKAEPSGKYIVQTGVFKSLSSAEKLKATLTKKGFDGRVQKIKLQNGQIWYRVALGPYQTEIEARAQRKRLMQHSLRGIIILQKKR